MYYLDPSKFLLNCSNSLFSPSKLLLCCPTSSTSFLNKLKIQIKNSRFLNCLVHIAKFPLTFVDLNFFYLHKFPTRCKFLINCFDSLQPVFKAIPPYLHANLKKKPFISWFTPVT